VVGVPGWGDGDCDCVSELERELMSDPGESGYRLGQSATAAAKWVVAESQFQAWSLLLAVAAETLAKGARVDERMVLEASHTPVELVDVDARGSWVPTVSLGFWNILSKNIPMSTARIMNDESRNIGVWRCR
jgi:hypothetical protein